MLNRTRSLRHCPPYARPVSYTHLDVYKRQPFRSPNVMPSSTTRPSICVNWGRWDGSATVSYTHLATFDMNHELAGQDLNFEITLVEVAD